MAAPLVISPSSCDRRLLRHFLARWWNPGRCYRVLDLSGSEGVWPREMVAFARGLEITLRIDAVGVSQKDPDFPEIVGVTGTPLKFVTDESYDLVHCALSPSCFAEGEAGKLLRRCRDLSTRWTLVSTCTRQVGAVAGEWLLARVMDGQALRARQARALFQQAPTFRELGALAVEAGWQAFGHARFFGNRQAIWMEGRELAEIPIDPVSMPSPA